MVLVPTSGTASLPDPHRPDRLRAAIAVLTAAEPIHDLGPRGRTRPGIGHASAAAAAHQRGDRFSLPG